MDKNIPFVLKTFSITSTTLAMILNLFSFFWIFYSIFSLASGAFGFVINAHNFS